MSSEARKCNGSDRPARSPYWDDGARYGTCQECGVEIAIHPVTDAVYTHRPRGE